MAQAYSITPLDSEGAAMQVVAVSGNAIAQLDEDELHYMVESGQSVRDLKRLLSAQVGCSRFQQRLFSDELGELEDDLALRTLSSVQLIILPLCAPDKTMEEELLRGCAENNVAQIEWLLQKPLDPNRDGLVLAASCGHLEVVRLLLEAGADKDAADTDGSTALQFAAGKGHCHLKVVRLLLEAGADKDAADTDGCTALGFAAYNGNGHLEVVRSLPEAGTDTQGWTASTLATSCNHEGEQGSWPIV
ncbi:unnamed protein product [Durusdinium trenchii]|uniref:Uncharacterized protein n=1 Tax=Durusdinium trenchii TaxID=1381693 RepID=A0ABP0HVK5_9DINO